MRRSTQMHAKQSCGRVCLLNLKQVPQQVLQVRAEMRGEANLGENSEELVKARREAREFKSSRNMKRVVWHKWFTHPKA